MNLRCIIADDEPVARKLLQEYIGDIDFLELRGSVENALKASTLLNSERIDLLFLDINMPKLSGIEFLRSVSSSALPMVIMTTAYAEYATEGFELDVLDYLVKPFSFARFLKACNKAKEYHELKNRKGDAAAGGGKGLSEGAAGEGKGVDGNAGSEIMIAGGIAGGIAGLKARENYFFVKTDGKIEKIFYDDLVHVEAMLNYVTLHTTHGKMIVYHTIKGILEQLPADIFLKVHKSSIVNVTKVKSIVGNVIDLGTAKVVISQNSYESTMKAILRDRMIRR